MFEKPYLFANDHPGRRTDVVELAREAEARGFPGVFSELDFSHSRRVANRLG